MSTDEHRLAELFAQAEALGERPRAAARELRAALQGTSFAPAAPAGISCIHDRPWDNFFRTVHADKVARQYFVGGDLADGVKAVSAIVKDAAQADVRVRAVGSSWSFSKVALSEEGWMVSLRGMRGLCATPAAADLANGINPKSIAHVLAGTIVQEINQTLEVEGRSLIVMGGNGGQAIAGAIATGTHGGWIGCPPIGDYVRGIGLVGADGVARWIESKTEPLTKDGFDGFGGVYRVLRDDALFHAAQASLGVLGIVTSVAIEVKPLFFVDWERRTHALDDSLMKAAFDHDFAAIGLNKRPDHFLVVINPHETATTSIEIGYRIPPTPGAQIPLMAMPPPDDSGGGGPWGLLANVVNATPHLVPALLHLALPMSFPNAKNVGAFSQIWPRSVGGAPMISMELAVARDQARLTWESIAKMVETGKPGFYFPGVIGMRNVKGTRALLGFTRFPETTTFELIFIRGTNGVDQFFRELDLELTARNVRHLFHPGQIERWDKDRMQRLFAPGYDQMRAVMHSLHASSGRRFGNATTDAWGLTP